MAERNAVLAGLDKFIFSKVAEAPKNKKTLSWPEKFCHRPSGSMVKAGHGALAGQNRIGET